MQHREAWGLALWEANHYTPAGYDEFDGRLVH